MPHPLLERAAQYIETARGLMDQFEDKAKVPAEVGHKVEELLAEAAKLRKQVEREAALEDMSKWLYEPQRKHDMGPGAWSDVGEARSDAGLIAASPETLKRYGVGEPLTQENRERRSKAAFFSYVRKGISGVPPELKAALVEDAQGEVLVPQDYAGTILREVPREAVIRNLAFVRPTSRNKVDIGVVNINAAGWGKLEVGDFPTGPPDGLAADPADKDTITVQDLYALVKLGIDELEDTDDDLAAVIQQALSLKIAEQEDDAFANGTAANKQPVGIAQTAGITQGVAAAAGQTVAGDELKKVIYSVPAWARRGAVWVAHTSAIAKIALLKDAEGRYLLQPNAAAGEPDTLFGYRLYTVDGLPPIDNTADAGAGTDKSVFFGNWRQGYMIADRRQLSVTRLVERYADEGKIGLLFRHRVGGAVIRPKAFAWYKL